MNERPYQELYIYMLDGVVSEEEENSLGNDFIGNWVEGNQSFLFFVVPALEHVSKILSKRPDLHLLDEFRFTYEEWQGGGLHPLQIDPFLIVPPWAKVDAPKGQVKIIIDPGVVFGTGLHPTTRDCLTAVAHLKKAGSLGRVMDLGTGTGILALAAASLGAKEVWALDANPLCVKTARRNVRLNDMEKLITVETGFAEVYSGKSAEIVLANIHYEATEQLMKGPKFREKEWFVFSGMMRSQAREFKMELARYGMQLVKEWDSEMTWYTMLVRG